MDGLAALRGLGMLIAGLPCLPWFIDSGWQLAFGVLPPYLAGGAVYNVAVAWLLFRRFIAKHT